MPEHRCAPDEFANRLKEADAGDTIVLNGGTLTDCILTIDRRCDPGRPLTICAADSGSVILTGNSSLFLTGKHIVIEGLSFEACILDESCIVLDGAADCRITDCRFSHSGGKRAALSIQSSAARNTVEYSEFAHLEQRSIQVVIRSEEAPVENRILENCFRDIPTIPSGNGPETIQIGQNQRD